MTQYPSYGFQYARQESRLLLSWVLMGRVYPVTESVKSADSLEGRELVPGFDSHYILTKRGKGITPHHPPPPTPRPQAGDIPRSAS